MKGWTLLKRHLSEFSNIVCLLLLSVKHWGCRHCDVEMSAAGYYGCQAGLQCWHQVIFYAQQQNMETQIRNLQSIKIYLILI